MEERLMAKISDRLRATMTDLPQNKKTQENIANSLAKPRSAPGIALFEHQQLMIANAKLAALESRKVKLSDLYEVEGRKRTLTATAFAELLANLEKNPLAHAIVVKPRLQGGYEVIAGHNRIEAYRQLGRQEIEADIREFSDKEAFEAAFYSNLFNSPLSDVEKYVGFKEIQSVTKENQKELASRAGVSEAQISRLFSFESLPAEAITLIKTNPNCIGCNCVFKLNKADNTRIVEAVTKLVKGEFTEAEAVAYAINAPKAVAAPSTIIRQGKSKFAEIKSKGNMLVINFKDELTAGGLRAKIEKLIKEASVE
jgi:ParB family transcriptional regulator, chromosome partitioning protein